MTNRLFTRQDVARKFHVQVNTAQKWFSLLEKAGFPFIYRGQTRMIHEKDIFVFQEFKRLQSSGIKAEEAAKLAVQHWRNHTSHEEHHPSSDCEDRSSQLILGMFRSGGLPCTHTEMSPKQRAVLDCMIASVDVRQLKNELIDRLSLQEVRALCKQLS